MLLVVLRQLPAVDHLSSSANTSTHIELQPPAMDPAAAESLPLPPVKADTGANTIFKELFAGTVSGWAQVMVGQPVRTNL